MVFCYVDSNKVVDIEVYMITIFLKAGEPVPGKRRNVKGKQMATKFRPDRNNWWCCIKQLDGNKCHNISKQNARKKDSEKMSAHINYKLSAIVEVFHRSSRSKK